jgi:hypothetical protein
MKSLWIHNKFSEEGTYIRVTLKSHHLFDPPIPSFSGFCKVILNLSTKCWNSTFNAQGSIVIIVVVHVGAMKIYVAAVEVLRKKERQDETQFTTKICGKSSLGSSYFVLYNFHSRLCYTFDALLCRNWPFSSPNRLTVPMTSLTFFVICSILNPFAHHYYPTLNLWCPLISLSDLLWLLLRSSILKSLLELQVASI